MELSRATTLTNVTRRDLLKTGGLAAAGAIAGNVLAANDAHADEATSAEGNAASSWKIPPAEIAEFVAEYDYDVVVVGHGYAGMCSCRELAESGKSVALIEKQDEESYTAVGNESCALNSKLLDTIGVPHVDPVEYYQNWMAIAQNYPNGELVMKFCQNVGEANDWYYGVLSEDELATMTSTGWPSSEHRLAQIGPYKFWPGTATFEAEGVKQTQILTHNREAAQAAGATIYMSTDAQYLVMEDGAVKGIVAMGPDGAIKFNCKAVIIATGGFCSNHEMLADLCPDFYGNLCGNEEAGQESNPFSLGRGIQMAYWAGARLETISIPTMNGKHVDPPTNKVNIPQSVWLDSNGKRFCNEYYPVIEQRGVQTVYRERQTFYCVFDSDILTYLQYNVPQHGTFNPTENNLAGVEQQMEIARQKYEGTYEEPEEEPRAMISITCCDETLEGLASQLGLEGEAAENFVTSIERYNEFCETGIDTEFGRYAETLFPVKNPPFYVASGEPHMGKIMCTTGGVITDGEQNALDMEYRPIPGLYVSGNDCGRRFGSEYFTPTPGVSLGMAITLGRECGRSVARFLDKA